MASAADYQVSFGYGAYDGVYYTASRPHRGNDRPCWTGTPIVINGVTIALSGATGNVSGPHLHTQAGTDEWCQNTINPTPYEFQPGTVVRTGYASQWGNYIIIKVESAYICYAHLNAIYVSVGQVISAQSTGGTTVDTIKSMYWRLLGREADQGGIDHYTRQVSARGWEFVYNDLKNSNQGQADWERRNPERVANLEAQVQENAALRAKIGELETALRNEQAKPPREVVKEIEKIVEKPVEVVKEIPVYIQDQATKDNVTYIRKRIDTIIGMIANLFKRK